MKKHAYLIIAHNNFRILKKQIILLDDERNDIYIHLDKKVKNFYYSDLKSFAKYSNIYFTKDRFNLKWGEVSFIETELCLYKEASSRYRYTYYHLISGFDMPLKSQDYMHKFFDEHNGKQFISFKSKELFNENWVRHLTIFPICRRVWSSYGSFMRKANALSYKIQELIKFDFVKGNLGKLQAGGNWCSLTDDFVRYLINKMVNDLKWYKYAYCGDEIYKQTVLFNSNFNKDVYTFGDLRLIDWNRGKPYTFTKNDYGLLLASDCFFARKFDENVDFEIVVMLFDIIKTKQLVAKKPIEEH